jgi:hypothetical protein
VLFLLPVSAATRGRRADAKQQEAQRKAAAIRRSMDRIDAELKSAGGDWNAWYRSAAPFREAFRQKIAEAKAHPLESHEAGKAPLAILQSERDRTAAFPVPYVCCLLEPDPPDIDAWAANAAFVEVARKMTAWFEGQGVALLLVPGPMRVEVCADDFVDDTSVVPANGILWPNTRRLYYELLRNGVEVVDIIPELTARRKRGCSDLFIPLDTHWSSTTVGLAAAETASRIRKMPWYSATEHPRMYEEVEEKVRLVGWTSAWLPTEVVEYVRGLPPESVTSIKMTDGKPFDWSDSAPILVVGDSFVDYGYSKGATIGGHIGRLLNVLVGAMPIAGNRTQAFQEMFRNPELLKGKKVVVWVVNSRLIFDPNAWDRKFGPPRVGPEQSHSGPVGMRNARQSP